MHEAWSQLASRKVLPKDFGFSRLARVCVALYVRHATAGTYFPEVVKLMESIAIPVSQVRLTGRNRRYLQGSSRGGYACAATVAAGRVN
jgi:hypothetical protein